MATTDFLPVATGGGANVDTQIGFAGAGYQTQGFQAGIAQSKQMNKVWRQSSMMAAAWAGICVSLGISVPDDGNLGNLQANLQAAILAFMSSNGIGATTGDIKPTLKTVADTSWVMVNDGSIGNATSNATTRANADTASLFTLVWNNISNANCPTQDATGAAVGRGASAAADFAANRRIVLPKALGRAFAAAGAGAGLTTRNLADTFGEELHTQASGEVGPHTHPYPITPNSFNANGAGAATGGSLAAATTAGTATGSNGGGTPFNVMQPTTFVNWMLKL